MKAMRATPTNNVQFTGQDEMPKRIRLGLLLGLAALAVIVFLIYFTQAMEWRSKPFLGVLVDHNMVVTDKMANGEDEWVGTEAGLMAGDELLSINGQPLSRANRSQLDAQDYQAILGELEVGDDVKVTFADHQDADAERPITVVCEPVEGGPAVCEVVYALQSLPTADFVAFFITPFISGVAVLAVGMVLLRLRHWDPNAFLIIVTIFLLALFMVGQFDLSTSHQFATFWLVISALLGASVITLGMIFPASIPPLFKQPLLRFVPLGLSVLVMGYLVANWPKETPDIAGTVRDVAEIFVFVGMAILAAFLHAYQRPRAASVLARDQSISVMIGVMLGLIPTGFWFLAGVTQVATGELLFPFSMEVSMLFFIILPISLAYAGLEYRRFDGDRMLVRAVSYSAMLVVLMMGYFLVVVGASLFTTSVVDANNPFLIVITIFSISLLFVPLRTQLQARIEEVYFRTRREYQEKLESFSRQLTSLAGTDVMIREFRRLLSTTIRPTNTLLFLINEAGDAYVAYGDPVPETDVVFAEDSGVIQLLGQSDAAIYLQAGKPWPPELRVDRARLGIIRVMVIAKMLGTDRINGFVCIGAPLSDVNSYNFEELRFINDLVGQLAVAIERDQVIKSLERRVRELDVLSQVGQAVNFTIEQDDLIELISAQTLKLIPSPFFYIALYDTVVQQFHFAFFQEHGDRDTAKENQKWDVGKDPYSEVVRSGRPKRVENYVRELRQNRAEVRFVSEETKAWAGVPLIAGANTLGVLAVGESDVNVRYTDAQLRILSDISALAATSLEKARLFSETNVRARQLAALNDISRQLVATEGDVDKLLDLITASAVDILNAEAGSLLLTVEDGSEDLEFRAAVGGTGHELVGQRLPAGYGLVGKVAETGTPVISNDTTADEDWEGEVAEEGTFRTKSLLAVPLPGKDSVVGVLEVINKQDGTYYVDEDTELLTTFAGQAAVAIENARLFQQTDIQLTRRVQELETLERIDRELNRALDLNKVAEITVHWCIENSHATAGVLGIINEERTHMNVVTKSGYGDADRPEGTDSDLWPLDYGILNRVLRNQRPDLQPNVEIDPDYKPLLRDSLSQITVPMLSGGEVFAMLVLETKEEPRLNLLDLDWVQRLAEHASIAIVNAQLYTELTRANESKSEFMAFAAHELKNPLTSVRGYTDTLLSPMGGMMDDDQRNSFFNVIRSNADRMQVIIEDLRDIARIDANQMNVALTPTNVRTVVLDALQSYQAKIEEKNQSLVNNVAEDLPLIMADKTRLVQVLVNLVSNANKYSPPEATITLHAVVEEHHRDGEGKRIGPAMRLSIQDTGMGMAEEDLQKLFHVRYFRTEEARTSQQPGTGLGMMITQEIVQRHGGTIWAESVKDEGTTFHFTIPLAKEEAPATEAEVKSESEAVSDEVT